MSPYSPSHAAVERHLESDVRALCALGERSVRFPDALATAADWIGSAFAESGLMVERQTFKANGVLCQNIEAWLPGFSPDLPHYLVGAHYDSAEGTPGADDNLSAVALMLALTRAERTHPTGLRYVAFVNEEMPFFLSGLMGSMKFAARAARRREPITGMICLESLGVFLDEPGSQTLPDGIDLSELPGGFDPTVGNFVGVVGNENSMDLAIHVAGAIGHLPPAVPICLPSMDLSDHSAFWSEGIPAIMVTDTAPFRNVHYHCPTDTPEKLNYPVMHRVLEGLIRAVRSMPVRV